MNARRNFLKQASIVVAALQTRHLHAEPDASPLRQPLNKDLDIWLKLRNEFNLDYSYAHFAGFLIASPPKIVRDDIAFHRECLDKHPAHYVYHEEIWKREGDVRAKAAEYLGVNSSQIALTGSTTQGLGAVYNGIYLKPGHEILTTVHDHYSTHGSLYWRAEKDGTPIRKITLFKNARTVSVDEIMSNVERNIRSNTRVLAFTWVHSGSGIKMPIAQIGKLVNEKNANRDEDDRILFCVDGVHGLGIENTSFDELNCDYLISGTHKWMLGPRGTGIICAKSDKLDPVIPTFESFSTYENFGMAMTPGGYHAFEHQWALRKAFEFHLQLGKANIQKRIHSLNTYLKEQLQTVKGIELVTPQDTQLSSGFSFFRVQGAKQELIEHYLYTNKIITSATERDAGPLLRMAPGLYNTTGEIDKTITLLRAHIGKV